MQCKTCANAWRAAESTELLSLYETGQRALQPQQQGSSSIQGGRTCNGEAQDSAILSAHKVGAVVQAGDSICVRVKGLPCTTSCSPQQPQAARMGSSKGREQGGSLCRRVLQASRKPPARKLSQLQHAAACSRVVPGPGCRWATSTIIIVSVATQKLSSHQQCSTGAS